MSRTKSLARRLGLLAGSSLIAAGLSTAALAQTWAPTTSSGDDVSTLTGSGNFTLNNGSVSFGTGADTVNVNNTPAIFSFFGLELNNSTVSFGAGADALNVTTLFKASGGTIDFGADNDSMSFTPSTVGAIMDLGNTVVDFGAGSDVFDQGGRVLLNGVTTFSNLEAFNNSGPLVLGGDINSNILVAVGAPLTAVPITDGTGNDVLRMTSGVFTGLPGSRIFVDANLGVSGSQLDCSTPTVADCADFTGATTAGTTLLNIRDFTFSADGGTLGAVITLVKGASAAEGFLLDPASTYYTDGASGPAIRKPVVEYLFVYDDATKRHLLVGAPGAEMFEVGTYAASAQEVWRATTGSWLTRQADLRATPGGLQSGGSLWGRVGGQSGERELETTYQVQGVGLDYDLTHKQRIAHLVFGGDFLGAATDDSAWVLGAMVGYARSDVEFEATTTEAETKGFSGGLYGSYVAGRFFVDGVFNANVLHMTVDAPGVGLGADVPMKFDLKSLGGQVEAGWRFGVGSGFFVEPLAGASYVVTRIDDTEVPGGSGAFEFEESKSVRLGGGARLGLDGELMGMTASYSLTGRYWNEGEGGLDATITTANGSSASLADDFGGAFSEVSASLGLYSGDGGVSGFVNVGGKFADGYQSIDGGVGVRVRW